MMPKTAEESRTVEEIRQELEQAAQVLNELTAEHEVVDECLKTEKRSLTRIRYLETNVPDALGGGVIDHAPL
jgi:hypothetical protein